MSRTKQLQQLQDLLRRCPDRLGCRGGSRAVQQHDVFRLGLWPHALERCDGLRLRRLKKFNFAALYERKLPSPFCPEVDIPEVGLEHSEGGPRHAKTSGLAADLHQAEANVEGWRRRRTGQQFHSRAPRASHYCLAAALCMVFWSSKGPSSCSKS